jgi:hypothetical protein
MRKLLLLSLCLFLINQIKAQRNPNTNSNKIKKDTVAVKPISGDSLNNYQNNNTDPRFSNNNNSNKPSESKSGMIAAALNYGTTPFKSTVLENGVGFSFKLGYNLLKGVESPIALYAGLGFDYLYFGGKNIDRPNNVTLAINSNAYGWYPYADLDIGQNWPITFFGTAFWGGRFFFTRQNINYFDANNVKQTDTDNIEGDLTNIYGYGGGLKFDISEGFKFELRYQKNFGNPAKVVDANSIEFDGNGNLKSYKMIDTDTDLDVFFLGLVLNL